MTELKPIIQGITSVSFFGIGIYLLVSKRLKSKNFFENDRIRKVIGGFSIALGISIALLMVVLQQSRAWQVGSILLCAVATFSCLFSGIYNLCYRQRKNSEPNDAKVTRIIGCLLILIGVWTAILFFLSVSGPEFKK